MIELEDAYTWFCKFETSHLGPSSDSLISQIRKALKEGHAEEARGLLQQLYDLAYRMRDDQEVTEILVECAHIYFMLNGLVEAERILGDCVSRAWSDLHRRAVIQWMLGCVQWESVQNRHQAVISWRNSLADFEQLGRQAGLSPGQHAWYQETCAQLEQSLLETQKQVGSYVDIDDMRAPKMAKKGFSAQTGKVTAATTPADSTEIHSNETHTESESIPAFASDILQLFTISEEIPAGDFGPSGTDPFPIGTVEIERVSINGRPYGIHSTRGRRIINLPFDQKLMVVKVKGDSMDQENINPQDYVLVRRVDVPKNGDIVMAEIVGIDSRATLKQFLKKKDGITLKPHSSNPAHTPFVFKKINEGFYIRGVVVAILKPLKQDLS